MLIEIDFQSEEALYMQLRNQIVLGIARSMIREGDPLPSVRQMAGDIGINMHTVNKAYAVLRDEGFASIDRRRGAIIALNGDRQKTEEELRSQLLVLLVKSICKEIPRTDVHALVDEIYDELLSNPGEVC
ncbi:MAG: GntR family transcriptional regulator [Lachnospiraceae bacterium]|nr:GntR family transcriptional regulator [Lachnospiraceae bacterium]